MKFYDIKLEKNVSEQCLLVGEGQPGDGGVGERGEQRVEAEREVGGSTLVDVDDGQDQLVILVVKDAVLDQRDHLKNSHSFENHGASYYECSQ